MKHVSAEYNKSAFHCLYSDCGAYAKQTWNQVLWLQPHPQQPSQRYHAQIANLMLAVCDHCGKFSIWLEEKLVHPMTMTAPAPHPDTPKLIKDDCEEARGVFQQSPRSSAALLRLAIQKLCVELGQPGKNLNADIGELVKQGLPIRVQQSLDIVRVVGNNQVHPGVLDVRDNPAIALALFELVNLIVEDRIAQPKQIEALYAKLPETARKQIEERDTKP
jgi:hypothetical protein